jgi:hypothetical protein
MREFFRGWRRKAGCVALVVASVFAAAWCRNLATDDYVVGFRGSLISTNGRFYVARQFNLDRRSLCWDSGPALFPKNMATFEIETLGAPYSKVVPLTLLSAYLILWSRERRAGCRHQISRSVPKMPFDESHECWLFPESLFDTRRSIHSKWPRIVARAYDVGSWEEALKQYPRRSILSDATDICINEGSRSCPAMQKMWRPYAPHHYADRHRDPEYVQLTLIGLGELWYTVGMLNRNAMVPSSYRMSDWPTWRESPEARDIWWLPILRGLVSWLPELELLSPRIANIFEPSDDYFKTKYGAGVGNLEWVESL